jgi:bifunctional non-homologous end joining protein LigD
VALKPASAKPAGARAEKIRAEAFAPELCRSQNEAPSGDSWIHEIKWDGYRIVATVVAGKVRLWSRNAIEWTDKVPELAAAVAELKLDSAQLDGEMIVLRDGRDDFNALQSRLSATNKEPAVYMLFDMPHMNGYSLRDLPLIERKAALAQLLDKHPHDLLRYSEHKIGHGAEVFAQAIKAGLEGIVAKKIHSAYSGTRNGDWVKVKVRPSDEFIVVGFTEPRGSRAGIGALLLAKPEGRALSYVGRVGTGLNERQLRDLRKALAKTVVSDPPADITLMERRDRALAVWVKPGLVVEVFYQGIGGQGLLRQPAFKSIRADKSPEDLIVSKRREEKKPEHTQAKVIKKTPAAKSPARARIPVGTDQVTISHPDRVVFPDSGVTKGDVAAYYHSVAEWIMPELAGRPLSVVRCPGGVSKGCFFQKHVGQGWGKHVLGVDVAEKAGEGEYLCIEEASGLLELVQMNVLEFHPWGTKAMDPERCDRIVFDLDPHASVKWPRVVAAARELRKMLQGVGLESFLRTSGGKGFHVVVPLRPAAPWVKAKQFAQAVAQLMATSKPREYVSVAGEKNRVGKIFIDWLRNGRGATSVASFSLRARPSAGVAMPLAWEAIGRVKSGDAFTIRNAAQKAKAWKNNPWSEIASVRQTLPK